MTTRRPSRRTLAALLATGALLAAGCSSSSSQPPNTPPIPTAPTITVATSGPATSTTAPATNSIDTAVPVSDAATTLPAETVAVTDAPAESTSPIPTAAPPIDPTDPNNQRTITPDQQPIIDAYLAVLKAELLTASVWPLDPRSPQLLAAPLTAKALAAENPGLVERTQLNQILDISGGITYRPYVVETDDPARVILHDCQIDATFWKNRDTGDKAQPDANWPNAGPPGIKWGAGAVMVLVDGKWLFDSGFTEPSACE